MLAAEAPRQQEINFSTVKTLFIQKSLAALAFFRQLTASDNLVFFAKAKGTPKTPEQVRRRGGGCGEGLSKKSQHKKRQREKQQNNGKK